MKIKRRTWIWLGLILAGLFSAAWIIVQQRGRDNTRQIALVAPLTGAEKNNGEEMVRGVRLYLEQYHARKGADRSPIQLNVYDDADDPGTAMRAASEIAREEKALAVLGHFNSSTSMAAGRLYQKNGIPAITASATLDDITLGNVWYFRIIPNNHFLVSYIVRYIQRLGKTRFSVIYDRNGYDLSVIEDLTRQARREGVVIDHLWSFDAASLEHDLAPVVEQVRSMREPGILFCAANAPEGAKILASLKHPESGLEIIGPNSFSTPAFIKHLKTHAAERQSPGFYSDGTLAVTPYSPEISGGRNHAFISAYKQKYNREPSWVAAFYYDAMHVVAEAMELSEIDGEETIREKRIKIRDAIAAIDRAQVALEGVTGKIYFNPEGDVVKSLSVLVYLHQEKLATFWQYQSLNGHGTFVEDIGTQVVVIEGNAMTATRIIHAGISLNDVSRMDLDNKTCHLNFFLWFHFEGQIDDDNIVFTNAISPVKLDRPIMETHHGKYVSRVYHIDADFRFEPDLSLFPFDSQKLAVEFQPAFSPRTKLIYFPENVGGKLKAGLRAEPENRISVWPDWYVDNVSCDEYLNEVKVGDFTVPFSSFRASVEVKRQWRAWFVTRNFIPLLLFSLILYSVYFIPVRLAHLGQVVIAVTVVTAALMHLLIFAPLTPRLSAIEYGFILLYLLAAMAFVISRVARTIDGSGAVGRVETITRIGKAFHFLAVAGAAWVYGYIFQL